MASSTGSDPQGEYSFEHTDVAGLPVVLADRQTLVNAALHDCQYRESSHSRLVFDVNGHGVALTGTDPDFKEAMEQADIVHADGGFIVTLTKWLGGPAIAERSATTDMLHDFCQMACQHDISFYLLGGNEDVLEECISRLTAMYPGLNIAGYHHGYFSESEEPSIVDDINRSGADILWVGLGKPKEQAFCVRQRERIVATWSITCGGCYNYVAGAYKRAPLWMQRFNIEWLHRMLTQPRKLFMRYLTTNPRALWMVVAERIRQGGHR